MAPTPLTPKAPLAALPGAAALVALLPALLTAGPAPAQAPPRRAVETTIDFTTGQDDNLFSVLRSQDHIHAFEQGLAEIAAGEHRAGVERLHRLLESEAGGVVPVGPGRFLGLRLAILLAMANLPPAARQAYEELVQREGGATASLETLSAEQLTQLAERFPTAQVGLRARVRLGDLALAAGDGRAAVGHFRTALDCSPIGSSEEARIAERWHCAMVLVDPTTARADAAQGQLAPAGDDLLSIVPPASDPTTWSGLGGGASGRTPMAGLAGQPDTRWTEEIVAPGFGDRDIGQYPMFAVGDLDGLFVNTGHEVIALDPLRRGVAWVSQSPMRLYEPPADSWRRREQFGGINQDMVLAAACSDEVVVAALQVPEKSMNVDFQGAYRVMSKIPMRRLYAFARQSGKVLWSHYDELDGPRTRRYRGHDACANPLVAGDTVYAPIHDRSGAIAFAIAAYDLRTGQQRWRRLVCSSQQDVNMFGNARTEFAASPIALHGGVIYGATNLGVAYALEAATGRLRWITSYDVVRMPRAMMHHQQERQVFFANNSPVVADGVVCMTPLDSQFVLGLDTESGRVVWRLPAEATVDDVDHRVVWLAGALGDEFVLAGAGAVAVKARPAAGLRGEATVRQLVSPDLLGDRRLGLIAPRPAVTDDAVWFARPDALVAFDRQGRPLPGTPVRLPRLLPGNLLLVGGIAVSLRQHVLDVAWDAVALRDRVEAMANARPDDPALLLRLASLRRALLPPDPGAEALAAVTATYRQGLDAAIRRGLPKTHPVRAALQSELFDQALARAEAALGAGSSEAGALLAAARDVAPTEERWIEVQALVLARCAGDGPAFQAELDRLLATAPDGTFPYGEGVPVRPWVAWQRARLAVDPAEAVSRWQELIERHGDTQLGEATAAAAGRDAIDELLQRHGPACYAAVQERAEAALRAAGQDREALELVVRRFPNSPCAATARALVLDTAVRRGDLAVAGRVLAEALAGGKVPPGVARRVLVAATVAGNHGLAEAMAALLRAHASTPSDWPDDGGRTFAEVLASLPPPPAPAPTELGVPATDLARITPRSAREFLVLATLLQAEGFAVPADAPLYVRAGSELLAIDVHDPRPDKPTLFALPFDYVEHVVLCGRTLVVPDMGRVVAVDYRTGAVRWELPNPRRRLLESLGVQRGVLHIAAIPNTPDGGNELLGIEPLSGVVLFTHRGTLKPKASEGALLQLSLPEGGAARIESIDPVLGTVLRTVDLGAPDLASGLQLAPESLTTSLYPQYLGSDGERLYLPVDNALATDAPRLFAIGGDGKVAWLWRGQPGFQLAMAARRGDCFVLLESHETRASRAVLLRATDGSVLREVDVGHAPAVLNWDRTLLANPAPAVLAVESFADADRTQRQLCCLGIAEGQPTFAVALGKEDGEVLPSPQFGPDFLVFGTRPVRGSREFRLHVLALRDRSGALPDGRKYRVLPLPGAADSMGRLGPDLVVSGTQALLLLGPSRGSR